MGRGRSRYYMEDGKRYCKLCNEEVGFYNPERHIKEMHPTTVIPIKKGDKRLKANRQNKNADSGEGSNGKNPDVANDEEVEFNNPERHIKEMHPTTVRLPIKKVNKRMKANRPNKNADSGEGSNGKGPDVANDDEGASSPVSKDSSTHAAPQKEASDFTVYEVQLQKYIKVNMSVPIAPDGNGTDITKPLNEIGDSENGKYNITVILSKKTSNSATVRVIQTPFPVEVKKCKRSVSVTYETEEVNVIPKPQRPGNWSPLLFE